MKKNKKEKLIQLITESNCRGIQCRAGFCPIYHKCTIVDDHNSKHIAIEAFIKNYSKEELMEILL